MAIAQWIQGSTYYWKKGYCLFSVLSKSTLSTQQETPESVNDDFIKTKINPGHPLKMH